MGISAEREQELTEQLKATQDALSERTKIERLRFAFDPSVELASRLRALLKPASADTVPTTLYSVYSRDVTRYDRNRYDPADAVKMQALERPVEHGGKANRPLGRYARVQGGMAELVLEFSVLMNDEMIDDLRPSKHPDVPDIILDRNAMRVFWAVEMSRVDRGYNVDQQTGQRIAQLSITLESIRQLIYGADSEDKYTPSPEIGASASGMRLALRQSRTSGGVIAENDLTIG